MWSEWNTNETVGAVSQHSPKSSQRKTCASHGVYICWVCAGRPAGRHYDPPVPRHPLGVRKPNHDDAGGLERSPRKPMHLLAKNVAEGLKRNSTYIVSPEEISVVWPGPFAEQEQKVRGFAEQNGWQLSGFDRAIGALITRRRDF